jgi:hypothetical protein
MECRNFSGKLFQFTPESGIRLLASKPAGFLDLIRVQTFKNCVAMLNEYKLITGAEVRRWLQTAATDASQALYLCSAYVKRNMLEDIFSQLKLRNPNFFPKIKVLARWQLHDLLSKASDLDAFEVCRAYGVEFYVKQDFHGKLYVDLPMTMIIGSANLTHKGFGVSKQANDEANVLLPVNDSVIDYLERVLRRSTLVDDILFRKIKQVTETSPSVPLPDFVWPENIINRFAKDSPEQMIVDEFFYSSTPAQISVPISQFSAEAIHDLSLLALSTSEAVDHEKLTRAFLRSAAYLWLIDRLKKFEGTASFGLLTKELHDTLLDDPRPYRSTVKELLGNLISWSIVLASDRIEVFVPRHSQIVRLKT